LDRAPGSLALKKQKGIIMPNAKAPAAALTLTLALGVGAATPIFASSHQPPDAAPMQRDAAPTVSPVDIQRLQDMAYDAGREISQLRGRGDAQFASRLQDELDDLRDEVIYLKVKIRKEGRVSRSEYADLRDRIEQLRNRARGDLAPGSITNREPARPSAPPPPPPVERSYPNQPPPPPPPRETARDYPDSRDPRDSRGGAHRVPVGQELDVRLQSPLSSATAQVEDRFEATTLVDVRAGDTMLIPAGSVVRGVVRSVQKAGRVSRKGVLTLSFDQITIDGQSFPIRATVTEAIESEGIKGEAGRIGTGAGVGAIIGGILGGFKGAIAGILIGGGGTVAATEGKDVNLDPGTILRLRFDSPLDLDE
jgi:hypothetical protein